jgi:hypothetical protein
MLSTFVFRPRQ